ncbi:MAG: hypothetical protein PHV78_00610 [Patescibacteria group bacterium]|nr:hypothetical protein [Patescibacteria group bacterium]MDD5121326.1 hypothetical protein [Patescibacteria group bacterium]MDD5221811.1 hypothetical protein [Patescibacteria group bacterium]MDD5395755.1 hypothetical protein [Patescibacteria group bacterium]
MTPETGLQTPIASAEVSISGANIQDRALRDTIIKNVKGKFDELVDQCLQFNNLVLTKAVLDIKKRDAEDSILRAQGVIKAKVGIINGSNQELYVVVPSQDRGVRVCPIQTAKVNKVNGNILYLTPNSKVPLVVQSKVNGRWSKTYTTVIDVPYAAPEDRKPYRDLNNEGYDLIYIINLDEMKPASTSIGAGATGSIGGVENTRCCHNDPAYWRTAGFNVYGSGPGDRLR